MREGNNEHRVNTHWQTVNGKYLQPIPSPLQQDCKLQTQGGEVKGAHQDYLAWTKRSVSLRNSVTRII